MSRFITPEVEEVQPDLPAARAAAAKAADAGPLPIYGFDWRRDGRQLASYLLDSEVHTFAFSVAANAILSFIPFIVLLYTIARRIFHSQPMVDAVGEMVRYFVPSNQEFVAQNLAIVAAKQGVQLLSLGLILVSCTGIFLPLEVALNRSWGVVKSRNYLMNQLVALGLAIWMLVLGVATVLLNSGERWLMTAVFFGHVDKWFFRLIAGSWMLICGSAASVLFFLSIYWLLPNRRLPVQPVLRVSIVTGLLWMGARYVFVALLPRLELRSLYGPFSVSVGLLLWGYVSGLILFAGAQFSAIRHRSRYPAAA